MSIAAPEGAVSVTAADVISPLVPERIEKVELWAMTSSTGFKEVITVRPENGDVAAVQKSQFDGSLLAVHFEFHSGPKNELSGRQYFPLGPGGYSYAIAFVEMPHYKEGDGPVQREMKRRDDARVKTIQERAAKLAEGLDDLD